MRCSCCGAAELVHDTRDLPYTYNGETTIIPAVTGDFCPACNEVILDREQVDRYSKLIWLFRRKVDAANVDPEVSRKPDGFLGCEAKTNSLEITDLSVAIM